MGVWRPRLEKGRQGGNKAFLVANGCDKGACKLLGDVIKVLGCLLEVLDCLKWVKMQEKGV
ncbi:hypothetical protein Tco_0519697, partial [Tanacetum coccineum]